MLEGPNTQTLTGCAMRPESVFCQVSARFALGTFDHDFTSTGEI
jgi:hypothetical protein